MIHTAKILFCDSEHGTGDVSFPDMTSLDGFEVRQLLVDGNSIRQVRTAAKAAGWGRIGGVDYCPNCMESERAD